MRGTKILTLAAGAVLAKKLIDEYRQSKSLKNKVVLITGGSKGLGLELARQLVIEGSQIAICARDEEELTRAQEYLGTEVFTCVCDVSIQDQTDQLVSDVINHFGHIDIIINNAGIIQVAPMESFGMDQYRKAMDIMYWGIANTTFSALSHMKSRGQGHIVNITSIGGKVSVPHLLPYCAAKFAATGFSQGCAAELRKDNIYVTTIIPGLMRTGSYINAFFQKDNHREFKLFALMSTAPGLTVSAEKAARRIIRAIKQKDSFKVIGLPAQALMEMNHLFPNFMTRIFALTSRIIPSEEHETQLEQGQEIKNHFNGTEVPVFREIGKKAQEEHQRPH